MIKNKTAKMIWNPKNYKRFVELGYEFTKWGDEFEVNVDDLSEGSHSIITAICDVCSAEVDMGYRTYLRLIRQNGFYRCRVCGDEHIKQQNIERYGVPNVFMVEKFKQKSKQTMMTKYGVQYNMQRQEMKDAYLNGEANIFWIDGRSYNTPDRNNHAHKKWRKRLLKIYNNQCWMCHGTEDLEAHHIYGFARNKDLAYNLENGVILCNNCHQEFHKKFGFDCTYDNFIQWFMETSNDYRKDMPFRDVGQNN